MMKIESVSYYQERYRSIKACANATPSLYIAHFYRTSLNTGALLILSQSEIYQLPAFGL